MSPTAKQLLDDAIKLPPSERSALISQLIESLDELPQDDVQSAWDEEIAERLEQLRTGRVSPVPWDEARQMILGSKQTCGRLA